jgi:hypothetical protein
MIFFMANPYFVCRTISPDPRFKVKPFLGRIARAASRYFDFFSLDFFEASRAAFLRRAARFLILSLPRLCPIYPVR